jgi:hypothetical protein
MKVREEDSRGGGEDENGPRRRKLQKNGKRERLTHRFFTRKALGEGAEESRRRAYACRKATALAASSAGSGMPLSRVLCCSAAADGR